MKLFTDRLVNCIETRDIVGHEIGSQEREKVLRSPEPKWQISSARRFLVFSKSAARVCELRKMLDNILNNER